MINILELQLLRESIYIYVRCTYLSKEAAHNNQQLVGQFTDEIRIVANRPEMKQLKMNFQLCQLCSLRLLLNFDCSE